MFSGGRGFLPCNMTALILPWSALEAQGISVVNIAVVLIALFKKLKQSLQIYLEQRLNPELF